jgi:hypothetical protein
LTDLRLGLPRLGHGHQGASPRRRPRDRNPCPGFFVLDDVTRCARWQARCRGASRCFPRTATRYTPASDASSLGGGSSWRRTNRTGRRCRISWARAGRRGVEIRFWTARAGSHPSGGTRPGINRGVWDRTTACDRGRRRLEGSTDHASLRTVSGAVDGTW